MPEAMHRCIPPPLFLICAHHLQMPLCAVLLCALYLACGKLRSITIMSYPDSASHAKNIWIILYPDCSSRARYYVL